MPTPSRQSSVAQFALYENRNRASRQAYPFFLDIQTPLLEPLNTRLVIPAARAADLADSAIARLCPRFLLDGAGYVLLTHQITSVPVSALTSPVASLEHLRDEIVAAIDFLVTGI